MIQKIHSLQLSIITQEIWKRNEYQLEENIKIIHLVMIYISHSIFRYKQERGRPIGAKL